MLYIRVCVSVTVERVLLCVCVSLCQWVSLSSTLVTATRPACWHSMASCGEGHAVYPCVSVCLSVGRFVKYAGYGNSVGLLAQRGLMWRGSCCISMCVCQWVGLSSTLVTATRSACWHSVVSCGEGHAVYPCVSVCLSVSGSVCQVHWLRQRGRPVGTAWPHVWWPRRYLLERVRRLRN